ncbi:sister chromatid cohesion protein 1 [Serendipita sp. 401]|nr:sister chromatid cohesion protein 1 [Serendipita sp. 401]
MAMFYADAILSKKSPLARVWLAAHYERKLSKAQTLQTDIAQSTKAIESRPLALRISGQLLLGVCRIYSRKAKYLLDDCNEALVKIKLAFRPGVVDMTDEQLTVPANAITLQGAGFDIDLFGDTWDFETSRMTGGKHLAREADINLPMQEDFLMNIDGGEWNLDLEEGGFGDLGVNFGETTMNDLEEDSMAIEVLRDAAPTRSTRESLASAIKGQIDSTELDLFGTNEREAGDFADTDMNIGDMDLALDFGDLMGNVGDQTLGDQSEVISRPSSPSEIQEPTTPKDDQIEEETPKKVPKKRKLKEKKQVIDSVTELKDRGHARGAQNGLSFTKADVSSITTDHGFLPKSEIVMRLLDIRADPIAHFFPIKATEAGSFYCFAPPGIAPEIADLFLFPAIQGAGQKRKGQAQHERATKRQRLESEPVDDIELLRGAEGALSSPAPYNGGADGFNDESGFLPNDELVPVDDFQFQVDDSLHLDKQVSSRNATPAPDPFDDAHRTYADEGCPVAVFDTQPQTQDGMLLTSPQRPGEDRDEEQVNKDGYSRNTVKAIGLLRHELEGSRGGKRGNLSFDEMTDKGSRRAASSFFFELLLLGTRDCVKLSQKGAFEDITIQGKKKLWEGQLTE